MSPTSTGIIDAHSASGTGSKAVQMVAKAFAWIVEQHRINRTIAALSSLGDHTLADIGVERPNIRNVARYGRSSRV
jgi:uncharacterized protein YjiS (DUF1127 family)